VKLLCCICYHHAGEDDLQLLFRNIENIKTYDADVTLVIHTNSDAAKQLINAAWNHVHVVVVQHLLHPHHLTWQHRKYMQDHQEGHDVVMYAEHDMLIMYDQICNYLHNLMHVWPEYVPGFLRYERSRDGTPYAVDVKKIQRKLVTLNHTYVVTHRTYQACWLLPTMLLKSVMLHDFCKIPASIDLTREHAASFVTWSLRKPVLLQMMTHQEISPNSCIYHASNKYVNDATQQHFSKTKLQHVLC
jgi:hypothetical protein